MLFLPRIELTSTLIGAWDIFGKAFSHVTRGNLNATILIHIDTDVFGEGPVAQPGLRRRTDPNMDDAQAFGAGDKKWSRKPGVQIPAGPPLFRFDTDNSMRYQLICTRIKLEKSVYLLRVLQTTRSKILETSGPPVSLASSATSDASII